MSASAVAAYTRSKSDFKELLQSQHSDQWPRPPWLPIESTGWNIKALAEHCDDASPSNSGKGFQMESKQKVRKYYAVKRVFSMRRTASASERYYRIHNQSYMLADHFDGEDIMVEETGSPLYPKPVEKQRKHKGGKIMKACKRFFNLK